MTSLPVSKRRRVELQYEELLPVELWVEILRRCEPLLRLRYVCRTWAKWIVSEPRLRRCIRSRLLCSSAELKQFKSYGLSIGTLTLQGCNELTDLSSMHKLKRVELYNCYQLTDVSSLYGVKEVYFSGCPNVKDVSSLAAAHKITFMVCNGLKDISALSKVRTLHVLFNNNVKHALSEYPMKNLSIFCHQLQRLTVLNNLMVLELDYADFNSMTIDVKCNIEELIIRSPVADPDTVLDLSGFTSARKVILKDFDCKLKLEQLKSMNSLHIAQRHINQYWRKHANPIDIASVANQLDELFLEDIYKCDISKLSGINKVVIYCCHKITGIAKLRGVHTLVICVCHKITDLYALRDVHTLVIDEDFNPVLACVKQFKRVDYEFSENLRRKGFSAIDKLLSPLEQ